MVQVIARHTVYRRVGDVIEKILPGTVFEPQHDDEHDELRETESTFHSADDKFAYERAMEGATGLRTKPGIVSSPIAAHTIAMEKDAMNGDLPATAYHDPIGGQAARMAAETARVRRAARNQGSSTKAPRASDKLA